MRTLFFAFALLVPLTSAAACSSGGGEKKVVDTSTRAGEATTNASVATAPTSGTPQKKAFVRTCETSVYGTLDAAAWRKRSVIGGPLVFYYADEYAKQPASLFAPIPGRSGYYAGQKLLVLVRRDAVVTVMVPESERPYVALLYNPAAWNDRNAYRVDDGESAVSFRACKKRQTSPVGGPPNAMTQFNGGFVVAGARCVPLEVLVRGQGRSMRVSLSFGAGRCPDSE